MCGINCPRTMTDMERSDGVKVAEGNDEGQLEFENQWVEPLDAKPGLTDFFCFATMSKAGLEKYLSLHALKATAGHFTSKDNKNDHKLFGDDIRLGNILVDPETFQITAVLDFEFWYIAPAQFLYSPPPWLMLKEPWEWDQNEEEEYKVKLRSYTKIMEEEEEACGQDHSFSCLMQQYMNDGTFWYNLVLPISVCHARLRFRLAESLPVHGA
ncbi:hypothetical protein BDZ45DRAFT_749016 [Acephala macrosclerotiorum]|nr:hypothetical protein BDZ45DRAFT_749016 [Acephala macrosclerotiorum]